MTTEQAIDMSAVMETLAKSRPVFHSEADFKHALSWQIQRNNPSTRIRQEVGNLIGGQDRRYVDIWLPEYRTVIELKYLTRAAVIVHGDEEFRLRDQSANDVRRYDFCLDISRLEEIIRGGKARDGYAIALTNDPLYWNRPSTTVALLNPAVTAVAGSGIAVPVPDGAVSTETITEQAQWDDYPSIPSG